jgi:hypothetical protein
MRCRRRDDGIGENQIYSIGPIISTSQACVQMLKWQEELPANNKPEAHITCTPDALASRLPDPNPSPRDSRTPPHHTKSTTTTTITRLLLPHLSTTPKQSKLKSQNGPPANPAHPRPAPLQLPTPHRPHPRQSRPTTRRNRRHRRRRQHRRYLEPRTSLFCFPHTLKSPVKSLKKRLFSLKLPQHSFTPDIRRA